MHFNIWKTIYKLYRHRAIFFVYENFLCLQSGLNIQILIGSTIGMIPGAGYKFSDVQFVSAQKWMKYLEIWRGKHISTSSYGVEENTDPYKIDDTYYYGNAQKV